MKIFFFAVLIGNIFDSFNFKTYGLNLSFPEQIPYTVALTMTKSNLTYSHLCTGAIINRRLVLTTRKCVQHSGDQFKPEEINVSSAAVYKDEGTDSIINQYKVQDVINIRGENNSQHEFSLLYLKRPITFHKKFGRISLSKPQFTITGGDDIQPAKWCKKMGVKTPLKLHVRFGRVNCGTTGMFRGKFVYYVCIAGKFFSTEFCYVSKIIAQEFLIKNIANWEKILTQAENQAT